jgi:hypothetical protein
MEMIFAITLKDLYVKNLGVEGGKLGQMKKGEKEKNGRKRRDEE